MARLRWAKVRAVVRREYLTRVRTKAFWISTLAFPVVMVVFAVLPSLLAQRSGGTFAIAVVAGDEELASRIEAALQAPADAGRGAVKVVPQRRAPGPDAAAQRAELKREVIEKRLHGAMILGPDVLEDGKFDYLTRNTSAFTLLSRLERAVDGSIRNLRLERAGIPAERAAVLSRGADLKPVRIGDDGAENASSPLVAFFLSYALMFLLWFSLMIYGMYVMRGVLEEKSSRIVEVVIANLSPLELMTGKIAGIGAVGLTQYLLWSLLAATLAVPGLLVMVGLGQQALISPTLLVFFVVFFLLGYALYSTAYAALGAAFNSEEEAQQMQSVAGWVMAMPFLLMFPVLNNPDSTLSVVLSLVPLFSPVLFFLRMTVQQPPLWQTVLCLVLLLGSIALVARFAAAIYRVGILMYGKRPTVPEIVRWMRAS